MIFPLKNPFSFVTDHEVMVFCILIDGFKIAEHEKWEYIFVGATL